MIRLMTAAVVTCTVVITGCSQPEQALGLFEEASQEPLALAEEDPVSPSNDDAAATDDGPGEPPIEVSEHRVGVNPPECWNGYRPECAPPIGPSFEINGCLIKPVGTSCPGADLRYLHLGAVALVGADLRGADLSGANLSHANLTRADLTGANLSRADLSHANFRHAAALRTDLRGANLSDARWVADWTFSGAATLCLRWVDGHHIDDQRRRVASSDVATVCRDWGRQVQPE
jgi:hypothetical protein